MTSVCARPPRRPCNTGTTPSSISQPISHTPAREPEATCRWETGTSPNPSRPSRTRPSNALDSDTDRAVFFIFSFTQRIKPHGPYTPKSEEPIYVVIDIDSFYTNVVVK